MHATTASYLTLNREKTRSLRGVLLTTRSSDSDEAGLWEHGRPFPSQTQGNALANIRVASDSE
jgi:hypothetical protein